MATSRSAALTSSRRVRFRCWSRDMALDSFPLGTIMAHVCHDDTPVTGTEEVSVSLEAVIVAPEAGETLTLRGTKVRVLATAASSVGAGPRCA